ncbi:acyltransferase family protein [Bradyrhizobium sp.]|uniref:acyltransferase family protein n=1 Tax=Bradyrhizobium sp. TaxID=376 RepID=UPI003C63DE27
MEQHKLPGIQIARAVAALSIAYFHSWVSIFRFPKDTAFPIPVLATHGWLAVDLFFAISGFVICLVASRPTFDIVSFLTKRVFRFYPLWLVTLTTFAVLALAWRGPRDTETLGYFLYSATLLPTAEFPFYDIGWSLQHEMVFYLIAALTVPIFGLYGLAAVLAASTLAFHTIDMPAAVGNFAMYHAEFLAGVLVFMARRQLARFGYWLPLVVGAVSFWYFVAIWGDRRYLPIALFFLIAGFANVPDKASRWLTRAGALGDASYSIYLLHPLVFIIASALVSKVTPPIWSEELIRGGCFVVILPMAFASWRYFERPLIGIGNRLAARLVGPAGQNMRGGLELQPEMSRSLAVRINTNRVVPALSRDP